MPRARQKFIRFPDMRAVASDEFAATYIDARK